MWHKTLTLKLFITYNMNALAQRRKFMEQIYWAKTLLNCYNNLERVCGALDKTVESSGVCSGYGYNSTIRIAQKILETIKRKKLLINAKVLTEMAINKLNLKQKKILVLKYFDNLTCENIAKVMNISIRSVFRLSTVALQNFAKNVEQLGFDEYTLNEMFINEHWIREIYNKIALSDGGEKKRVVKMSYNSTSYWA